MQANRRRLIADGVIAGMIGYGVVASFFVVVNLVTGRSPFHTANLLGAVLFGGADAAAATIEPGLVIAFNGVHLAAFLVIGFFAAWLVYETELHPVMWYVAFFLFLIAGIGTLAVMLAGSGLAGGVLAAWQIVTASLLATLAMGAYLLGGHRALFRLIPGADERLETVD